MTKNGNAVLSNVMWRFMERCGAQGVTLIVSIILARLIDPNAYGIVAIVTAITSILQTFVDAGLGNALIQKKNADDLDFSSVFYFNLILCTVLYIGLYIFSPFIAEFYDVPDLAKLIRVLGLMLIISGVKNVQQAYVSKHMMFKKFFFATLAGTIGAAFLGIWMAYAGYGVWALVIQQLFNTAVDTIVLWIVVKWRPIWQISFRRLKTLLAYGWKLLVSDLIDKIYGEARQLIIGKRYSTDDLAYYTKGGLFPKLVITNVNSSINSVLLPAISECQDDIAAVKQLTKRAISLSTYVIFPMMIGLAVCAESVVKVILTEKWLPCVPFLRIFCFTYMLHPLHTANLNALKAIGRSDLFLKLEIYKKIIGLLILVLSIGFGPLAICCGMLLDSCISLIINAFPNKRLLNYSLKEQFMDIFPQLSLSLIMGVGVIGISFLGFPSLLGLLVQVSCGVVVYLIGSLITKNNQFQYLWQIVKTKLWKGIR